MTTIKKTFKSKLLTTAIFFCALQILFLFLQFLSSKPFFGLLSLEQILVSDGSFNDLYYHKKGIKNSKPLSGKVIIINSGSFDNDSFRLQLAKSINYLQTFSPKVVAVDHTFSESNLIGTDSLINSIEKYNNIILSSNDKEEKPLKIKIKSTNYAKTEFINDQIIIRRYNSDSNTFAYKIASLINGENLLLFNKESFFINYLTDDENLFTVNSPLDTMLYQFEKDSKFIVIEGRDLLTKKDYIEVLLRNYAQNNAFLIGHMGSDKLFDVVNDREDRYQVPCDKNLVEKKETMFGVQIHANVIENYLNPDVRFNCWSDSTFFFLFRNILIFLFIYYTLFINYGKALNIISLAFLTYPIIYIVLYLMTKNIYIEIGLTMLQFLFLEEVVEVLESIFNFITKFIEKCKKK
jgi:hypothetical protein